MMSEIERARSQVRRRRVSFPATKGSLRLTVVEAQADCSRHFRKKGLYFVPVVQLLNSESNSVAFTWHCQALNTHVRERFAKRDPKVVLSLCPLG